MWINVDLQWSCHHHSHHHNNHWAKAKRAAHFVPTALSSEVGSDDFSWQTNTHFIILYIIIIIIIITITVVIVIRVIIIVEP